MPGISIYQIAVAITLLSGWLITPSQQALAQSPQPAKVVVGNVELHYIEQGAGEPVILLHGGQGDYRAWSSLMGVLAQRYRVISYSRRYHWPNANTLIATNHSALIDANDLAGFINELGLRSAHLVGTSYGAFTALALAIGHPEMVRSLVLAEPPVLQWITNTARGAALYRERVADVHEPAKRAFAKGDDEAAMRLFIDAFDGPGTFDRLPGERRTSIIQNAKFFRALTSSSNPFPNLSKNSVRRLKMPVLVIQGAETDELHRMVTEEVGRVLRRERRVTIPKAGHGSPRQNPQAFNEAVREFLERQDVVRQR